MAQILPGVLKAVAMALGDNPRFVVTSLNLPKPQTVYADLYCPAVRQ